MRSRPATGRSLDRSRTLRFRYATIPVESRTSSDSSSRGPPSGVSSRNLSSRPETAPIVASISSAWMERSMNAGASRQSGLSRMWTSAGSRAIARLCPAAKPTFTAERSVRACGIALRALSRPSSDEALSRTTTASAGRVWPSSADRHPRMSSALSCRTIPTVTRRLTVGLRRAGSASRLRRSPRLLAPTTGSRPRTRVEQGGPCPARRPRHGAPPR